MNNSVFASFQWSADEFLTAQKIHMRHSALGRKVRRGTLIFGPLGVVMGIAILVTRGFQIMGLVLILMGAALVLYPLRARQIALKHYSKRPDRDMAVSWEFQPGGVTVKTRASCATFEWAMIAKILQTTQGFLLYPNDQSFHWVPAHAFCDAADPTFTQLAKSKVQRFDCVA